jgi:uncharacterized protein (DUF934 family)
MADLISNTERTEIRDAMKDVADTFFKTPVAYEHKGETLDFRNEDRPNEETTIYNLMGMVEYPKEEVDEETGGSIKTADAKVTLLLEDLEQIAGVIDGNNMPIFDDTRDYFTAKGKRYKVTFVMNEGPLDEKDILVVVYGDIENGAE